MFRVTKPSKSYELSLVPLRAPKADRVVSCRSMLPLVRDGAKTAWCHIAKTGTWRGHSAGEFDITRASYEQAFANFNRQTNPVVLDYEHMTLSGSVAPAAGWVHEMRVQGNGLYALVEFTERAAAMVESGEYRFTSAVWIFDAKDRQSAEDIGVVLHSVALTNTPFIDGLEPVRLS